MNDVHPKKINLLKIVSSVKSLYLEITFDRISNFFRHNLKTAYLQGPHSSKPFCTRFWLPTGSFAQNSFQIESINSFTTKKRKFRLKIVKIAYFLTLKLIKGTLGFILEIVKKTVRNLNKECKHPDISTIIPPLGLGCQKK